MALNDYTLQGRKLSLSVVNYLAVLVCLMCVGVFEHAVRYGTFAIAFNGDLLEEAVWCAGRALFAFALFAMLGCFDLFPLHSRARRITGIVSAIALYLVGEAVVDEYVKHIFDGIFEFGTFDTASRVVAIASAALAITSLLALFPGLSRMWAPRLRVLTELSSEELTRINWALAKRKLTSDVELLNARSAPKDEISRFTEQGLDFLVLSDLSDGLCSKSIAMLTAHLNGVRVLDVEEFVARLAERVDVRRIDVSTLLSVIECPERSHLVYRYIKCAVEPIVAVLVAMLLSPLIVGAAIAVRFSSPGPILYRQKRVGQFGKVFTILKFRSMRIDAESAGPQWSSSGDSRVTKVGKFLRATRLDELPQLWNVMTGTLSFIGPRPERPEFVELLNRDIPAFALRTILKPGITGWAQVRAGYAASVDESLTKVEHDLYYAAHVSFLFDIEIILRTLVVAVVGDSNSKPPAEKPKVEGTANPVSAARAG